MLKVVNTAVPPPLEEATFFPFDRFSMPLTRGLTLRLVSGKKHPESSVLRMGKPGTPDSCSVAYYGTIIGIDGEYRMWYQGTEEPIHGWPGWRC